MLNFLKKTGKSNFGHIDLSFGEKAREEVFPVIYEWLKKRV